MKESSRAKQLLREKLADQQSKAASPSNPLLKYNNINQLVCKICHEIVKSEAFWTAHANSRNHKEALDALKNQQKQKQQPSHQFAVPEPRIKPHSTSPSSSSSTPTPNPSLPRAPASLPSLPSSSQPEKSPSSSLPDKSPSSSQPEKSPSSSQHEESPPSSPEKSTTEISTSLHQTNHKRLLASEAFVQEEIENEQETHPYSFSSSLSESLKKKPKTASLNDDFDDHLPLKALFASPSQRQLFEAPEPSDDSQTELKPLGSLGNQLPQGFFDDPKIDAKARNVKRDSLDVEMEKFKEAIRQAEKDSNQESQQLSRLGIGNLDGSDSEIDEALVEEYENASIQYEVAQTHDDQKQQLLRFEAIKKKALQKKDTQRTYTQMLVGKPNEVVSEKKKKSRNKKVSNETFDWRAKAF